VPPLPHYHHEGINELGAAALAVLVERTRNSGSSSGSVGDIPPTFRTDGLRLDTNRLNTSHSQRLNSGKPLGTGRCGWWCLIDPCPNEALPFRTLRAVRPRSTRHHRVIGALAIKAAVCLVDRTETTLLHVSLVSYDEAAETPQWPALEQDHSGRYPPQPLS